MDEDCFDKPDDLFEIIRQGLKKMPKFLRIGVMPWRSIELKLFFHNDSFQNLFEFA
jgi:hypothetical protein